MALVHIGADPAAAQQPGTWMPTGLRGPGVLVMGCCPPWAVPEAFSLRVGNAYPSDPLPYAERSLPKLAGPKRQEESVSRSLEKPCAGRRHSQTFRELRGKGSGLALISGDPGPVRIRGRAYGGQETNGPARAHLTVGPVICRLGLLPLSRPLLHACAVCPQQLQSPLIASPTCGVRAMTITKTKPNQPTNQPTKETNGRF